MAELEKLAHTRGLKMGQLLRLLIRDYLTSRVKPDQVGK